MRTQLVRGVIGTVAVQTSMGVHALDEHAVALAHARRAARVGQRDHVLIERVGPAGRLHGYGADYTAYELRAHAGAGVGDLVEVVLEAPGERVALGRVA